MCQSVLYMNLTSVYSITRVFNAKQLQFETIRPSIMPFSHEFVNLTVNLPTWSRKPRQSAMYVFSSKTHFCFKKICRGNMQRLQYLVNLNFETELMRIHELLKNQYTLKIKFHDSYNKFLVKRGRHTEAIFFCLA